MGNEDIVKIEMVHTKEGWVAPIYIKNDLPVALPSPYKYYDVESLVDAVQKFMEARSV